MNSAIKTTAIKQAQLLELTASSGITIINSTVLAILMASVLRDLIPSNTITAWLLVFISLNIVRLMVMFKHKRQPAVTKAEIDKQLNQFRIGLIASGVLWAFASIYMFPAHALMHEMFFIFILAGLSAGCIVSYSADVVSAMTFMLLILIPMLIRISLTQDEIAVAMAASVLLYIVFLVSSIRKANRNLLESVSARYDANEREKEIKQLAFYDELTSLPNRRLMHDRLNHALAISARTGRGGALIFLDLDHFKLLNDNHGHDMGDLLLKQVAERLVFSVRASDTVARLGGDEFTVIVEDLSQDSAQAVAQADTIAKQIITSLNLPYQLNTLEYHISASIGIALFSDDGSTHEELLKNADIAMYKAKNAGRNMARFFKS
jgi:diguanylate cyclase (GGDEF)-like protein